MVERFDYDHTMSETLSAYPDGQFVRYSDYAELEAGNERLRTLVMAQSRAIHSPESLSALEPAAPEDHKAASAASVDPDGIWERAYAETAGVALDDDHPTEQAEKK